MQKMLRCLLLGAVLMGGATVQAQNPLPVIKGMDYGGDMYPLALDTMVRNDYIIADVIATGANYGDNHYVINYNAKKKVVTIKDYSPQGWFQHVRKGADGERDYYTSRTFAAGEGKDFMATAIERDPLTGVYYGCFSTADDTGYEFCTIDFLTYTRTTLAALTEPLLAIGITNTGDCYGITSKGAYVSIDKATGALTPVAQTTLADARNGELLQTERYFGQYDDHLAMTTDPVSGRMFLTRFLANADDASLATSDLWEVEPATGTLTKIGDLGLDRYDEHIGLVDIWIDAPYFSADKAPAKITDGNFEASGASLTTQFTFTMPDKCADGTPLTGTLKWYLHGGDDFVEHMAEGEAQAGAQVNQPYTFDGRGKHTNMWLWAENEVGPGDRVQQSALVGPMRPQDPQNVKISYSQGKITITWDRITDPVAESGNYWDPDTVRYCIDRLLPTPKKTNLKWNLRDTCYVDSIGVPDKATKYQYQVVAGFGNTRQTSTAKGKSNTLTVTKPQITLPWKADFSNKLDFSEWLMLRNDSVSTYPGGWFASGSTQDPYARMNIHILDNIVDATWVSIPVVNRASYYEVRMQARCYKGKGDKAKTEFRVGLNWAEQRDTAAITAGQVLIPETNIPTDGKWLTLKNIIKSANANEKFLGLRGHFMMQDYDTLAGLSYEGPAIRDLRISGPYSDMTPGYVTNFSVQELPQAEPAVKIDFNCPTTRLDGTSLENWITDLRITRDGEVIHTFTEPVLGQAYSFTDTTATVGDHTYAAFAYGVGAGPTEEASLFVGYVAPYKYARLAPITVTEDPVKHGQVTLHMPKVRADANGKLYAPGTVKYNIYKYKDSQRNAVDTLAYGLTDTVFTLQGMPEGYLGFVSYLLNTDLPGGYHFTGSSYSEYKESETYAIGVPLPTPFKESCAKGALTWPFDVATNGYGQWGIAKTGVTPQDNDGGMFVMVPSSQYGAGWLYTVKVSLAQTKRPALSFYVYNQAEQADSNEYQVCAGLMGQREMYDSVMIATPVSAIGATKGWHKVNLDLSRYGTQQVNVCIRAMSLNSQRMYMDNVTIDDVVLPAPVLEGVRQGDDVALTWKEPTDIWGLGLKGYRVLRDDKPLCDTLLTGTLYLDKDVTKDVKLTYKVVPVYTWNDTTGNGIDGDASNAVDVMLSEINDIEVGDAREIARYSVEGRMVDDRYRGVVIVRYANGAVRKLIAQ